MNESFTIGKLAKKSRVNIETIRFYERKGLIKQPNQKQGAFRVYSEDYIFVIEFIKKAQDLGFTLKEIKELLKLDQNNRATCANVSKLAEAKLAEVKLKMTALKQMERSLKKIVAECAVEPSARACCRVSDCFESKC